MNNIFNIYGNTGVGKSFLIKNLDINKKDVLIIDFKDNNEYVKFSTIGFKDPIENPNENTYLELFKLLNQKLPTKFIIFENFERIFPLIKTDLENFILKNHEIVYIFVTQHKLLVDNLEINYLEIKQGSSVEDNKNTFFDLLKNLQNQAFDYINYPLEKIRYLGNFQIPNQQKKMDLFECVCGFKTAVESGRFLNYEIYCNHCHEYRHYHLKKDEIKTISNNGENVQC